MSEQALELPQVQVRAMQALDIPDVVAIERASYAFPWTEGIFRDCLRVNYMCRAVEIGAIVIGYGIMSLGVGEAHLLNLCIAENFRCRGVGRRLLNHLLQLAGNAGALEAFLETRPSNSAAIRLYESLGFAQIAIRRGYYQALAGREDAIVLKRRI
ncbi:MAG: ribosomal protein S18-alanine N-acetyltransferase [Steroidobacterales bacterium]